MTATMGWRTGDLDRYLDSIDQRLGIVEQIASGAQQVGEPVVTPAMTIVPDTLTPGPIYDFDTHPPGVPGVVTVMPGAFFDDIFADVHWTAPTVTAGTTTEPVSYEIEFAEGVGAGHLLISIEATSGTSFRLTGLQPSHAYAVRVLAISALGIRSAVSGWVEFNSGVDTTIPAAPTGLFVYRAPGALIATWNANTESDVKNGHGIYRVEMSTDNFATLAGSLMTSATVASFDGINAISTYKVRVVAIDSSGNEGPPVVSVAIVAGSIVNGMLADNSVTGNVIAAGTIVSGMIAAGQIVTTHMTAGSINGDRITTNTLVADKITSSSMTIPGITMAGGQIIVGTPPTTGVVINSQGIRGYKAGVQTFTLDQAGNATFAGTLSGTLVNAGTIQGGSISGATITGAVIRTASSGRRIELNSINWMDRLNFYTGDPQEINPGLLQMNGNQFVIRAPQFANAGTFRTEIWMDPDAQGDTVGYGLHMNSCNSRISLDGFVWIATNFSAGGESLIRGTLYVNDTLNVYGPTNLTTWTTVTNGIQGNGGILHVYGAAGGNLNVHGYAFVSGNFTAGGSTILANVSSYTIDSSGYVHKASAFTVSSSRSLKREIRSIQDEHDKLLALRPARFKMKMGREVSEDDPRLEHGEKSLRKSLGKSQVSWSKRDHLGLVAEEVEQVLPEAVDTDEETGAKGINYNMLVALLIHGYQRTSERLDALEAA